MLPLLLQGGEKQGKVSKLMKNEVLMLNIGSMCTGARVVAVRAPSYLYPACLHAIVVGVHMCRHWEGHLSSRQPLSAPWLRCLSKLWSSGIMTACCGATCR